jgi:mono/diheme cytochrome c family protein
VTWRHPPRPLLAVLCASALGAASCTEHHFDPPDREQRIAQADSLYRAVRFDTITWPSDSVRAFEGNVVFSSSCRTCHGPLGRGGTEYAAERDLEVPSLVEPDWRYAGEPDSVRHRIFVGHVAGMPTWGVAGITPREIDAVTHYLLEVLRPELLQGG